MNYYLRKWCSPLGVASRYVGSKSKAHALQENEVMNGIKYMICKWDLQARTLVSNYDVAGRYAEQKKIHN
jgi:hypothetical protein